MDRWLFAAISFTSTVTVFAAETVDKVPEQKWENGAILTGVLALFAVALKWILNRFSEDMKGVGDKVKTGIETMVQDSKSERTEFTASLALQRKEYREELQEERRVCHEKIKELGARLDRFVKP